MSVYTWLAILALIVIGAAWLVRRKRKKDSKKKGTWG